ncbi:unnamed protein product [Meganyctiphanes norvegica]|uniref:Cyclin-dependent kinase inhibitor domain-containing protein n=1 Tax=Meganyctiphanes norvegica TaxID=48144 RepID=A0AAV2RCR9_MEGNR
MALTHRKANSSDSLRPILGQRLKPIGGGNASRALSFLGGNDRKANLRLAESLLTISQSEFRTKWNFDPIAETPLPQGQFLWKPVKPTLQVPLVDVKLATAVARPKTEAATDLAACFKLPKRDFVTKLNDGNSVCKISENSVNQDIKHMNKTHKELRSLTLKETTTNKQLCPNIDNNNIVETNREINNKTRTMKNLTHQRQPVITEYLRTSKRPVPTSSVFCEASTSTSGSSVISPSSPPPTKLRRVMSDGDTS